MMFRLSSDADSLQTLLRGFTSPTPSPRHTRRSSVVTMAPLKRAESRARLSRLVAASSEMIHRMQERRLLASLPKCVCVPNSGPARAWDMTLLVALIYVAIVTPFQMAFLHENNMNDISTWMGLFVIDRIVDLVFLFDIAVNFRTSLVVYHDSGEVDYQYSCKEGCTRYLRTWFFVDVISILPIEVLDLVPSLNVSTWSRISKIFKLFRFAKLLRMLRVSRIFSNWEKELVLCMSYGLIRIVKLAVLFLAVVHWLGCVFYFATVVEKQYGVP
jgi:hypothetical protein